MSAPSSPWHVEVGTRCEVSEHLLEPFVIGRLNEIHEGLDANRETDESGERSQNEEYQDDFDQRYREKSKAYERMDEINKLKQPLKPGKDQIRKDLNPEAVMREYVEEDFGYRKQNAKGQISQQDAKAVILNWAENVLGFDP